MFGRRRPEAEPPRDRFSEEIDERDARLARERAKAFGQVVELTPKEEGIVGPDDPDFREIDPERAAQHRAREINLNYLAATDQIRDQLAEIRGEAKADRTALEEEFRARREALDKEEKRGRRELRRRHNPTFTDQFVIAARGIRKAAARIRRATRRQPPNESA